jgi:very-short-patch-repair endonuclease
VGGSDPQRRAAGVWRLTALQHGHVTRQQLIELGYTRHAIRHRILTGRLHPVRPQVYAVGRPEATRAGELMAVVLSCGPSAVLSHGSAAELWGIRGEREREIHVTVPPGTDRRQQGIAMHRRSTLVPADIIRRENIPLTTPVRTLIDLATRITRNELEAAINEADKLDLVDPEGLRAALDERKGHRGVGILRRILDVRTFRLTDSELERRFLALARRAGLPTPLTQQRVNGFRVDFYWPHLGLVVETDGLRYHRTPAQQAKDHLRDQIHAAAGLSSLRYTHAQIRFEPERVQGTLTAVARRLSTASGDRSRQWAV